MARRVAVSRDKPPAPVFVKQRGRAIPATAFDDELLQAFPEGQEFDLTPRWRRGNHRKHALYWKLLSEVVKATGGWATSQHLHDELKRATGYWRPGLDLKTGRMRIITDSTAWDQMNAAEFDAYFDAAVAELARHLGVDPFEYLKGPR